MNLAKFVLLLACVCLASSSEEVESQDKKAFFSNSEMNESTLSLLLCKRVSSESPAENDKAEFRDVFKAISDSEKKEIEGKENGTQFGLWKTEMDGKLYLVVVAESKNLMSSYGYEKNGELDVSTYKEINQLFINTKKRASAQIRIFKAISDVWAEIPSAKRSSAQLLFTGHSLGGGVAQFLGAYSKSEKFLTGKSWESKAEVDIGFLSFLRNSKIYTFASPQVFVSPQSETQWSKQLGEQSQHFVQAGDSLIVHKSSFSRSVTNTYGLLTSFFTSGKLWAGVGVLGLVAGGRYTKQWLGAQPICKVGDVNEMLKYYKGYGICPAGGAAGRRRLGYFEEAKRMYEEAKTSTAEKAEEMRTAAARKAEEMRTAATNVFNQSSSYVTQKAKEATGLTDEQIKAKNKAWCSNDVPNMACNRQSTFRTCSTKATKDCMSRLDHCWESSGTGLTSAKAHVDCGIEAGKEISRLGKLGEYEKLTFFEKPGFLLALNSVGVLVSIVASFSVFSIFLDFWSNRGNKGAQFHEYGAIYYSPDPEDAYVEKGQAFLQTYASQMNSKCRNGWFRNGKPTKSLDEVIQVHVFSLAMMPSEVNSKHVVNSGYNATGENNSVNETGGNNSGTEEINPDASGFVQYTVFTICVFLAMFL